MERSFTTALLFIALAVLPAQDAHAQQSGGDGIATGMNPAPITLEAHRPSEDLDISLDGRLDEAA